VFWRNYHEGIGGEIRFGEIKRPGGEK